MSSSSELERLEAESNYYRDRVSLLRAKLYGRGEASSARLQQLERTLEQARRRLRDARAAQK